MMNSATQDGWVAEFLYLAVGILGVGVAASQDNADIERLHTKSH